MTKKVKTDEEIGQKLIQDYLDDITAKTGRFDCLYRGQKDARWGLESGAERRLRLPLPEEAIVSANTLVIYHEKLLSTSRNLGFGIVEGRELKDLEILAKLQHFKAATALLDFTRNPLIALYFACERDEDENVDKDENKNDDKNTKGQLFALPKRLLTRVDSTAEIENIFKNDKINVWTPMVDGTAERRIIRQHSIFVAANSVRLEKEYSASDEADGKLKKIIICKCHKAKILKALKKYHQISAETLFIDLQGFAANNAPDKSVEPYMDAFSRGSAKLDEDDLSDAIDDSNNATDIQPDSSEAYFNRGLAKSRKFDFDGAIADYTQAIRLTPDFAEAYHNRGVNKRKKDDVDGAIKDFDQAIRLTPDFAEAYNNRGSAKADKGDNDGAIEDYNEAIRLKPDLVEAYNNHGTVKGEKGDIEGAINDFDKAIDIKPDYAEAYYNRGVAKGKKGDSDGAIEDYTRAIDRKSDYTEAYYNRGFIKEEKGDIDGAKKDIGKALFFATEQKNADLMVSSQQILDRLNNA